MTSQPSRWNDTTGLRMQAMGDPATALGDPRFSDHVRLTIDSDLSRR